MTLSWRRKRMKQPSLLPSGDLVGLLSTFYGLQFAFAFGDVLHYPQFFGFTAFGRFGDVVEFDGGALGEVLSDFLLVCHENGGSKGLNK